MRAEADPRNVYSAPTYVRVSRVIMILRHRAAATFKSFSVISVYLFFTFLHSALTEILTKKFCRCELNVFRVKVFRGQIYTYCCMHSPSNIS